MNARYDRKDAFRGLVELMAALRGPEGCPWDRKQTHRSLRHSLIEETYEVVDAIDRRDFEELKGELGDLLLQVVFHLLAPREGPIKSRHRRQLQLIQRVTAVMKRRETGAATALRIGPVTER